MGYKSEKVKLGLISLFIFIASFFYFDNVRAEEQIMGDEHYFANQKLLNNVFEKLYRLENYKQGKVNIVHIGDSHIQGDFFTNTIRKNLQDDFGDGGIGFTFPYTLMGTNGPRKVRYNSNTKWESLLNVYPVADVGVGLSGIALYTSSRNFILQLSVESKYRFSKIKIVYPSVDPHFSLSVLDEPLEVLSTSTSGSGGSGAAVKYHKVKKGEGLFTIARRYGVTVVQLKSANGLKKNNIRPGQTLRIPGKSARKSKPTSKSKVSVIRVEDELGCVQMQNKPYYSTYVSDTLMSQVAILADGVHAMYNLNGFVLENNNPGIIYHSIGVNGAKLSDYNKYPLFFKQLPILEPDFIILSFGTNESFGKMSTERYLVQMRDFINNVKFLNPNTTILVMTPPPSLFRRSQPNPYISDYTLALMGLDNVPVWDLYSRMGGMAGIKGEYSDFIARDNVHYTAKGYELQGDMFLSDFMKAYDNFKKYKRH